MLTIDDDHEQRAIYIVEGEIICDDVAFPIGTMLALRPNQHVTIRTEITARIMIVGGAKLDGERHIFWNFVSSSETRIERAKDDWRAERFPIVPSDEFERISVPNG
jgi:redox-sensitive bicupin YhaK (pirin superfamily)